MEASHHRGTFSANGTTAAANGAHGAILASRGEVGEKGEGRVSGAGGEFDRERNSVQPTHNLCDRGRVLRGDLETRLDRDRAV